MREGAVIIVCHFESTMSIVCVGCEYMDQIQTNDGNATDDEVDALEIMDALKKEIESK